jgi:hypothetical protein
MLRNARVAMAGVALTILLAGCGKKTPPLIIGVEGIVRLDGKPLNKVEVRFFPAIDHGPEYVAIGVTDESGRFKLTCKGQAGACAGENRVVIVEAELPSHLKGEEAQRELARYLRSLGGRPLPERYGNAAQSPLSANVSESEKEHTFELQR